MVPLMSLCSFFAGHGVQIGSSSYLCFPETQPTDRTGMVPVDSLLVPWFREMEAKLTMVYLDACRDDLGPVRAAGITRGLDVKAQKVAGSANDCNLAVFFASKSGEYSYEKADGSGGFFTDTLLEGLNADTTTTVGELFSYLRQALPGKTDASYGHLQIPRLGGDVDLTVHFTKGKVDASLLDTGGRLYVDADQKGARCG